MKTYRITYYDDEGNIHKIIYEGDNVDFISNLLYHYLVSVKELEE